VDDKYLIVILVLAILFGASRLPSLGRNFGQGIREFKKGIADGTEDDATDGDEQSKPDRARPDGEPAALAETATEVGQDQRGQRQGQQHEGEEQPHGQAPQHPTHEAGRAP
jgi:sec-independent protein translocase protein TatA